MELRHFRNFIVVAENLSFTVAAEKLQMAQPPLTQQIQALESELGVTLFDRRTRPIQLTAAGQVFLEEARSMMSHLAQSVRKVQRVGDGEVGSLTIGIHNSVATSILPILLTTFRSQFPLVILELREVTIDQEIPLLKNHQLDVVFHRLPSPYENDLSLSSCSILQESFVLVLPETHRLASCNHLSIAALHQESLILPFLEGAPFYQTVIETCTAEGIQPRIATEVKATGIVTLLSLVATGIGLTILPSHVQTLHREGVVYRPISGLNLDRKTTLVWRKENDSPVLHNFLKLAKTLTGELTS